MKLGKHEVENFFYLVIITKGLHGLIEIFGGIMLFFVKSDNIKNFVFKIFQHELLEDPNDLIANYVIGFFHHISINSLKFSAIYLLCYGSINLGLSIGILLKKYWSYIIAGMIIFILVIYQFIRIFYTHSIVLLFFTIIDIILLFFMKSEYVKIKNKTD